MDQVINALNELHHKAVSAIGALQQGHSSCQQQWLVHGTLPAVAGSYSSRRNSGSSNSSRRVHFAPPFASLSPLGRAGGRAADSKKQKKQQDEEEERILISEVSPTRAKRAMLPNAPGCLVSTTAFHCIVHTTG